jgi:hypothetical protein
MGYDGADLGYCLLIESGVVADFGKLRISCKPDPAIIRPAR